MDTKALRQKILDLAIRGKLVPQDPNDEPASVLLERIRAEKQQMVKDGKLKPKDIKNDTIIFKGEDNLHYEKFPDGSVKCIEDEIPFELPQGWECERLSNMASFSSGKTPSTSKDEYWGDDYLWITSKDMKSKYIDSSQTSLSEKGAKIMQIKAPDTLLLVARSGILRHTLPVAILKKRATINQDIKAISLYDTSLAEFIYSFLKGTENHILLKYIKSGTTVENINFDEFKNIIIPVPPKSEQILINEKINTLLSFIETIESDKTDLQATIQLTKSKILDLAIRGKLVPQNPDDEPASVLLDRIRAEKEELIKQGKIKRDKKESVIFRGEDNSYYEKVGDIVTCIDEELPFDVPDSWGWVRLENCCSKEIKRGKSPKYTEVSNTLVFAQKCNTKNNGINIDLALCLDESVLSKYPKDEFMQDKDSVINSTGTGTLGRVGIYRQSDNRNNLPIVSDSHVTVIRAVHCIDADYIYIVLKAHQKNLEKFGEGSTNQKELKPATLKQLFIPLPPLKEQKRMVDLINSLYNELDQIEKILS